MAQLEELLQQCTVKLTLPHRNGWGTGFFVAPQWILTCAHVVQQAEEAIQVQWQNQENWSQAVVERSLPNPYDLALLRVTYPAHANPPCVYLDTEVKSRDPLYLFGYPDEGDRQGEPRTFNCDGITGSEVASILFNLGQVRPGMSGSPLLNQRTGKVCGIVKFTRDRSSDLGGGAIPTRVILEQFPELVELQREFHEGDRHWSDLVAKLSSDQAMSQSNLGGTNHQIQTGADNINFVGGEHHHHGNSAQSKQPVRKILMLSANPEKPHRREEINKIRKALKRARGGALFELEHRPDIEATDLSQELSAIEPYVIDISGNGNGIEGLVLENTSDDISRDLDKLIGDFFKLYADSIECIILNGCYLENQSKKIACHVKFVIGISQDLEDVKIIDFLDEFYYQLGSQRPIENSYDLACSRIERKYSETTQLLPVLLKKDEELKRRKLEEKLTNCDKRIEQDPDNVKLWEAKAKLLRELGRSQETDEAYEKAASLAPSDYKIRAEQGDTLEQFGKHDKAVDAYDKALELEQEDYKVWWKKGQALVEVEEYSEAVKSYDKAVTLKPPPPDNYIICREYGSILKKLGQYEKSVNLYKKSLMLEPRYRTSSYEKKQVYKKMYSGRG